MVEVSANDVMLSGQNVIDVVCKCNLSFSPYGLLILSYWKST